MKEDKLFKIAQKEVQKLNKLLKSGSIAPKYVSFDIFMEGVVEDYHVAKEDQNDLEAILKKLLAEKEIELD